MTKKTRKYPPMLTARLSPVDHDRVIALCSLLSIPGLEVTPSDLVRIGLAVVLGRVHRLEDLRALQASITP